MKHNPTTQNSDTTSPSTPCSHTPPTARRRHHTQASAQPGGMLSRQQLAAHWGLSVRTIDELTRHGVLGYYKIGKVIRYDLAEVESAMRSRFHVPGSPAQGVPAPGRAGCPQPAAPKPTVTAPTTPRQENLHPALDQADAESQQPPGGGLRTSLPTSGGAVSHPAPGRAGCPQPAASKPIVTAPTTPRQENLHHALDQADTESQQPPGGGLRTSLPTSGGPPASRAVPDNTTSCHEYLTPATDGSPATSAAAATTLNPAA